MAAAPLAAPVMAAPLAVQVIAAPRAAPVQSYAPATVVEVPAAATSAQEDAIASQDKVREMAAKLGIKFTPDLVALGSNSAISDALIEKAVAAGKTEAEINTAMASL